MTKKGTPLYQAEETLRVLQESGASAAEINVAEKEVVDWKIATREFTIQMVQERFN